ncbi:hypothetical protein KJS94_12965 [Flavihumibacter rivuli]|uniref:tetratricopeptide repeat protein n=1 Tax=Flavihumibacter rivuli TaxID=2838156 RepID=UPI001BDEAFD2|nr:hypothetical protein [Flavihumibacter rivuli]ULQ55556.1 hypothetical protein KJS94_12965 [Flavihumibacter rivuli]
METINDHQSIRLQLERILRFGEFRKSPILSRFLRYIVEAVIEGKSESLKEYTIATNVLRRGKEFNPQFDAAVRIHAVRLRKALRAYYDQEGVNDPIIIEVPTGGYIPNFITLRDQGISFSRQPIEGDLSALCGNVTTVAVLPFKSLGEMANKEYLVDGFCEKLSAELSAFQDISVIAYYSSNRYKNASKDLREIARELGTTHLITGTILQDGDDIFISANLVDGLKGTQLWSRTYEHSIANEKINVVFNDIISTVIPLLGGYYGLLNRSMVLATHPDPGIDNQSVQAVFWYYHYMVQYKEQIYHQAVNSLQQALKVNPHFAMGWAILAHLYVDGPIYGYKTVENPFGEALKFASIALEIDPMCQHGHLAKAWALNFFKSIEEANEHYEKALSINPSNSFFQGASSFGLLCLGKYERSIELYHNSVRLNPFHPWWVKLTAACYYLHKDEYEIALDFLEKIQIQDLIWVPVFRIAVMGHMNMMEEASDEYRKNEHLLKNSAELIRFVIPATFRDPKLSNKILEGVNRTGLIKV